jgi:hypothetical protein
VSEAVDPNQQTPASRLIAKLEAFYAGLPEDEKRLLSRIVQLAAKEIEVEGYATQTPTTEAVEPPGQRNPIDDFRVNLGLSLRREE